MNSAQKRLAAAIQKHTAGDLQAAERLYRELLQSDPSNAEALHLLGVIAHQVGQHQAAVELIERAVSVSPNAGVYYSNLGSAYQALGKLTEAVKSYRRAVKLAPQLAEAHGNLGNALHTQGQFAEAVAAYQRALQIKPDYVEAYSNLANALRAQGKLDEAVQAARRALELRANHADAHFALGAALRDSNQPAAAIDSLRRAIEIRPSFAEAHNSLGIALQQQGRLAEACDSFQAATQHKADYAAAYSNLGNVLREQACIAEAVAACRRAIELKQDFPEAHGNLGNALMEQGEIEEAVSVCSRAVELNPDFVKGHNTLGAGLFQQGDSAAAIASFERAIQIDANDPESHNNLALVLLANADFDRGWAEYEWRWKTNQAVARHVDKPVWDGKANPEATVLIQYEQGLGDTIQFMRYLPLVKQRCGRVIFECQKPLYRLIRDCCEVDELVAQGEALPSFDAYLPLMSVPRVLETTLNNIPADVPYLHADPALVAEWSQRLEKLSGRKVGICWQGNPSKRLDQFRSVPLAEFVRLAEIPEVTLISLQKGHGAEQLTAIDEARRPMDLSDTLDEQNGAFMDTAAVMMALDLVITCDTAIAHLAGALGAPVWLVAQYTPDWRWLRDREDSPWYPSMRIFRQTSHGDWAGVFDGVTEALRA